MHKLLPFRLTGWLPLGVLTGLGCLGTFSCKKEAEPLGPVAAGDYAVTAAQARTAAENVALSPGAVAQRLHRQPGGGPQRVFQVPQRVLSTTAVPAGDGQPGLYLCAYAQGGFAIIAADRHMPPVLAFAADGTLPTSNWRDVPPNLATWLENPAAIAAALRQHPGEQNTAPGAAGGWASLVDAPLATPPITPPAATLVARPGAPRYARRNHGGRPTRPRPGTAPAPPPTYTIQRGPLVQSTWGQDSPYNYDLLINGSYRQTGCVATSMGQTCATGRPPLLTRGGRCPTLPLAVTRTPNWPPSCTRWGTP